MTVYEIDGVVPIVHPDAFVHPDAVLIGDVVVGPGAYIGPLASLRGDFGQVIVDRGANIQDGCVVHSFPGRIAHIEEDGHVGHGAVLHGCRVGRGALIGMSAVVMDGADVGEFAFVGACSFVQADGIVPPRHLAAGVPATVKRPLTEEEMSWKANGTRLYQELAVRSIATLRPTEPLRERPPDRRTLPIDQSAAMPLREYRRNTASE
jgi:phenylacetic acid degradation protein